MRNLTRRFFLQSAWAAAAGVWLVACGASEQATKEPDQTSPDQSDPLAGIANESGQVLDLEGVRVAIYKDAQGQILKLSPTCPHKGCEVAWNEDGKTWDCPCHASRFEPTGERISGPATTDLESID